MRKVAGKCGFKRQSKGSYTYYVSRIAEKDKAKKEGKEQRRGLRYKVSEGGRRKIRNRTWLGEV